MKPEVTRPMSRKRTARKSFTFPALILDVATGCDAEMASLDALASSVHEYAEALRASKAGRVAVKRGKGKAGIESSPLRPIVRVELDKGDTSDVHLRVMRAVTAKKYTFKKSTIKSAIRDERKRRKTAHGGG